VLLGRTRYLDDIALDGMVHMAFVRSPYAHARIEGVRGPDEAPGLVAFITAADLPADLAPLPVQAPEGAEVADAPHPLLAVDEVRYAGQPVAAVVAESRALAEDVAELVEVDYEPLDVIVDAGASREALMRWERSSGDVNGAFAVAARVVAARHRIPRLVAAPIEPRGAAANYDAGADALTVWCSAQETHRQLAHLAQVLGRSEDRIHMIVPDVGGAFGSKGALAPEAAVVVVAAIALGRPVKWTEWRMENFLGAYQGRGVEAEVELALDDDGRMLGVRARLVADLGAYLMPATAVPPHTMAMLMTGCYDIAAAEVRLVGARTNKVPTGPLRGAGRPEAAYLLERTVDAAARELGIDRVELRRRNLIRRFPHRTPLGWTYDSGDYERCLDTAVELVRDVRAGTGSALMGTGYAMYVERSGGLWESAEAAVERDGRVLVRSSTSPHGQGHDTTFAQIAADRLGVDVDDVVLRFGDSAEVPRGVGTFASRSVAMGGSAVATAADELHERIEAARAVHGDLPLAELAAAVEEPLRARARFSSDLVFSSGAYAAVVEIDPETGFVTVLRVAAVDDAGRIVNPLLAEGQVVGGTVHGLGAVLTEEMVHDAEGQPTTGSFVDYALLSAAEVPEIVTAFVESPSPLNPLGAKGIGEGGSIGAPAAVANAVADVLGGVALDPPFTPERIWRTLQSTASPRS
jgi:aerobic carbon-monoxide dehydrogenase large subunit